MMEERRLLYPMKFIGMQDEQPWGIEAWKVADLGFRDSKILGGYLETDTLSDVMDTYLERMTGEDVYAYYGRQFPLSVKELQTKALTPLVVSPEDTLAEQRYDALGKAKLWYVEAVEEGACLYVGLRRTLSATQFYAACLDGTIKGMLHEIHPEKGAWYFIAPGTLHCAGAGLKILEIAEASDLDIPVCDWSGTEHAGFAEALDFVNLEAGDVPSAAALPGERDGADGMREKWVSRPELSVGKVELKDALRIQSEEADRFSLYCCVEGEASVQVPVPGGMEQYVLRRGEVILIPAEVTDYFLVPRERNACLLECGVGHHETEDTYLDNAGKDYRNLPN